MDASIHLWFGAKKSALHIKKHNGPQRGFPFAGRKHKGFILHKNPMVKITLLYKIRYIYYNYFGSA